MITGEQVKELRDKTGISVMQCKKALEEADGDMEKAIAILKKNSSDIASKKADRDAKDGAVVVKTSGNKTILVTLHCETDFVAKNEDFTNLISKLADLALSEGVEKMKESSKAMIDPVIQKTGEKIELGEISETTGETIGNYVHNNKSAVVVSLNGGNTDLAKDIAMHIAAMRPEYISEADITEEVKKQMKEIFEKEVADIDKPEDIKQKMLQGKMSTYFKEKTLLDQSFIKNADETIKSLLEKNKASIKEIRRSTI
ncbi:MAG: translation elongation factor Ts [Candidatus Pacebacteria bacterium]|nr:translation elongation factor Ts [Candidatus Paceibacterota bacterium]MCF7862973.1 translation elongation factor Ts [Candidatus Paceibacterota bacterium]